MPCTMPSFIPDAVHAFIGYVNVNPFAAAAVGYCLHCCVP